MKREGGVEVETMYPRGWAGDREGGNWRKIFPSEVMEE